MNLYAYVGGNPVNAIDPKGLMNPDLLCPPNWDNVGGNCLPNLDPGGCPYGQFSGPDGVCGETDDAWPWNKQPEQNSYCGSYSKTISVCADTAAIYAAIATFNSGGVATPVTAGVGVVAQVVSIANGVAHIKICGPSPSDVTGTIGTFAPGWWGVAVSALDALLAAAGL